MKKIKTFSVLILALVCYTCQQDITKQNQELIIGDWTPIIDDELYDVTSFAGYIFEEEYCENKIGYYEYFSQTASLLEFPFKLIEPFCFTYDNAIDNLCNVKHPYGYRTLYKLEEDSLLIFDLADKAWVKYQIHFPSKDTIFLSNKYTDKTKDRFVRKAYQIDNQPLIDEFIFYYPSSCISNSKLYLIRRDGFFFSYGYFGSNHFLIGQLQDNSFNRLDTLFKKADLSAILNGWDSLSVRGWERPLSISENVSFVINNQVTTIDRMSSGYFGGISIEYYWTYLAGLFLPDLANIKPINESDYPELLYYEFEHFFNLRIKIQDKFFEPPATEQFYLGSLLCYAEKVKDKKFEPKYTLTGLRDENKTMQTDGRYYKYTDIFGSEITLDIGFNFIEDNFDLGSSANKIN